MKICLDLVVCNLNLQNVSTAFITQAGIFSFKTQAAERLKAG